MKATDATRAAHQFTEHFVDFVIKSGNLYLKKRNTHAKLRVSLQLD